MSDFINFCDQLSPLTDEAREDILTRLQSRSYSAGDYLLKSGKVCRQVFYIEKGLTKTFFQGEDKEFIMRFFPEHSMFTVLDSYVRQIPSTYMIIALEATTVTYIDHSDLEVLCKKHHCVETFFRRLISLASVNMMKRISEMLEEDATSRYHHFLDDHAHLLQRISLGDLASYLGITQVSLSRIRSRK